MVCSVIGAHGCLTDEFTYSAPNRPWQPKPDNIVDRFPLKTVALETEYF